MSSDIKKTVLTAMGLMIAINIIAQWSVVTVPTGNNLNSIVLSDSVSGWVVGDRGTILQLKDELWTLYPLVSDDNLKSICLVNDTEGWAVGARGTILHLKDSRWEKVSSPTNYNLHSVCFSNPDYGYAVGENGTFLSYRNGLWENVGLKSPWHFYAVTMKDNLAFIAGGRESITVPLMTVSGDGNYRFTEIHNPGYVEITGIAMQDMDDIWAVGRRGAILQKKGDDWKEVSLDYKLPSLTGIFFSDEDLGLITGHYGLIMTYSGGDWQKETPPVKTKLNGGFIAGSTYFVVGNGGTLLKSDRNPLQQRPEAVLPDKPLVIAPYPNPTSGILSIKIPESVTIRSTVTISNSIGQTVYAKELDGGLEGNAEQINIQQLGNGLYLVNISSGGRVLATGKFIVKN